MNFDGSKTNQGAAAGFIIRDFTGGFLSVEASNLEETSIIIVDATTMRNWVHMIIQSGYKHLIIEGDDKMFIKQSELKFIFHGKSLVLSKILSVFSSSQFLFKYFISFMKLTW